MATQPIDTSKLEIDGEVRTDALHRLLFAQDASVYQKMPQGVVFPRNAADVQQIVRFASDLGIPITPRAAGTSLAGQTVGDGLIVDTGRHMNQILELNVEERWVRVQPGVILDDLNRYLAPHGLFFGPDTSTSSRCMIAGMIGNNSCGSHSILYGNTMQHVLELDVVMADGELVHLEDWDADTLEGHKNADSVLGNALRTLDRIGSNNAELIRETYPPREVLRRNTGYPIDDIVERAPYTDGAPPFSLARFMCGTEGTLGLTVEAKLNVVSKPEHKILVCVHFDDLLEAMRATVLAVEHDPAAVELIDRRILHQTINNTEQQRNRFFIEGDPAGVLVVEFYRDSEEELEQASETLIAALKAADMGYAYPIVRSPDDKKVWALRKAGLGILMGIPGDTKAVSVVEDTAVPVPDLPDYIADFMALMDQYGTQSVYHAHASVGELHLRPELNLKDPEDVKKFIGIAEDTTDLVRKYRGSLSGEHGDGRVRSPLIERFYGPEVFALHKEIKQAFDPKNILNPGIIVDAAPMDHDFRIEPGTELQDVEDTVFDWSGDFGLLRAVEKCNGAGVCRKRAEAGGTMCPSYMATLDEKDTTRGRANVFRHVLLEGPDKAWTSDELADALDLCLSCKGCQSECPANVDMARMKAEFLQHRHDRNGVPLSARFFGDFPMFARMASITPGVANFFNRFGPSRWIINALAGVAPQRDLPPFTAPFTKRARNLLTDGGTHDVWLYVDPFTEYTDAHIADSVVNVLQTLGYRIHVLPVHEDGRTQISKGLVRKAKSIVNSNLRTLKPLLDAHPDRLIVGIEPSALLTFRDESPLLAEDGLRSVADELKRRAMLFDEFLLHELNAGRIDAAQFEADGHHVVFHGHCYQKAIVGTAPTEKLLGALGFDVETLPTGCCGMAGSFGYEAKHYDLSMKIGELVLFPRVRAADSSSTIMAPGTSCRHQIHDGTGKQAVHPAQLLESFLKSG